MPERNVTIRISAQDGFSQTVQRYNQAMGQAEHVTARAGNAAVQQRSAWSQLGGAIQGAIVTMGIMGVARFGAEMLDLGQKVQVTSQNFDALTQSVLGVNSAGVLQDLKEATGGIVSNLDLMAGANRLLAMGLVGSTSELERMTEGAVKLGAAFGRDAASSIENFSLLMANKSILRLDSFGISAGKVRTRLEELKGTMSDDEAWNVAVLEQMDEALRLIGPAAEAGETAINKLGIRITDFKDQAASDFAEIVNMMIDAAENTGTFSEFAMNLIGSRYIEANPTIGEPTPIDPELNAAVAGQPSLASADALRQAINLERERVALVQVRARELEREPERLMRAGEVQRINNSNDMRRNALIDEMGPLLNGIAAEYQNITDAAGEIDGVDIVNPEDAERVAVMADRFEFLVERARALNEQGIISDAQLQGFEDAATRARDMADQLERGALALEDMSASDLFGTTGGGLLGELSDEVIQAARDRGLTEEQINQLRDAFDVESGRENEASMRWRDEVIPLIVETARSNSTDAAVLALQQYIGETAAAQFGPGAADYLANGNYFNMAAVGVGNAAWSNMSGEGETPTSTFSEIAGYTTDMSTDFEDIATHAAVFGDKITAARDDLMDMVTGAKTITLDFAIGNMPPLLAELLGLISGGGLAGAMAGATRDNGGVPPGSTTSSATTTRSASTRGNTRNR